MAFAQLGLNPFVVKAVAAGGYTQPTAVQTQAIPATMTLERYLKLMEQVNAQTPLRPLRWTLLMTRSTNNCARSLHGATAGTRATQHTSTKAR